MNTKVLWSLMIYLIAHQISRILIRNNFLLSTLSSITEFSFTNCQSHLVPNEINYSLWSYYYFMLINNLHADIWFDFYFSFNWDSNFFHCSFSTILERRNLVKQKSNQIKSEPIDKRSIKLVIIIIIMFYRLLKSSIFPLDFHTM